MPQKTQIGNVVFLSSQPTPQEVVDGLLTSIFRDAPSEEDAKAAIIMALLEVAKGYRRETRQ